MTEQDITNKIDNIFNEVDMMSHETPAETKAVLNQFKRVINKYKDYKNQDLIEYLIESQMAVVLGLSAMYSETNQTQK